MNATATPSPTANRAPDFTVIVNVRAGSGAADRLIEIERAFARAGVIARLEHASDSHALLDRANRGAARGDVLVAAGGDGTVNAVASVAVETNATFGVVPLGTLNHFARDVGIPTTVDDAVRVILARQVRALDVADVNGRLFVNNSSIGLYPRLVWERQQEQRRGRRKWSAFAIAVARTWWRHRAVAVRLKVDGQEHVRRTPFVFIGNNEYFVEGVQMGGRAVLDAGQLSIYAAPHCGRFELLALPFQALTGRLRGGVPFEAFAAREVSIQTAQRRVSVALDGEVTIMRPPLRYSIRPGALRTIVPAA